MEKKKILIIGTGGTIDKDYKSCAGTYNFEISEPAVKRILENVNPNFEYEVVSILKKDSLDMTDEDRQLIYDTCNDIDNEKIIITHGADTLVNTAEKLSGLQKKVIILVGSSKPERFKDSDAPFNIGMAIGAINIIDYGIYITMNGRIYKWNECQKEPASGQFIEK